MTVQEPFVDCHNSPWPLLESWYFDVVEGRPGSRNVEDQGFGGDIRHVELRTEMKTRSRLHLVSTLMVRTFALVVLANVHLF